MGAKDILDDECAFIPGKGFFFLIQGTCNFRNKSLDTHSTNSITLGN